MMKGLGVAVLVAALVPATSFAQRRRGGGRMRGGGRAAVAVWDESTTLLLFEGLLDLTDTQERELTTVFDAAAKTAQPLATAVNAGKTALFEAVTSGQSSDKIESLAARQGALTTKLEALQARTFAKMWALLSAGQKSKVDDSIYTHIGEFLANTARVELN